MELLKTLIREKDEMGILERRKQAIKLPAPESKNSKVRATLTNEAKEIRKERIEAHKNELNAYLDEWNNAVEGAKLAYAHRIIHENQGIADEQLISILDKEGVKGALEKKHQISLNKENIKDVRDQELSKQYAKRSGFTYYDSNSHKVPGQLLEMAHEYDAYLKRAQEKLITYLKGQDPKLGKSNLDLWLTDRDLSEEAANLFLRLEADTQGHDFAKGTIDHYVADVKKSAIEILELATTRNRQLNGTTLYDTSELLITDSDTVTLGHIEKFVHSSSDIECLNNLTKLMQRMDNSSIRNGNTGFAIIGSERFQDDLAKAFGGGTLGDARALHFREKLFSITSNAQGGQFREATQLESLEDKLLSSNANQAYKALVKEEVKQYRQRSLQTSRETLNDSLNNIDFGVTSTVSRNEVLRDFNKLLDIITRDDGLIDAHLCKDETGAGGLSGLDRSEALVQDYMNIVRDYQDQIALIPEGSIERKNAQKAYDLMESALSEAVSAQRGQIGSNIRNIISERLGDHLIKSPNEQNSLREQLVDPEINRFINNRVTERAQSAGISNTTPSIAQDIERLNKRIKTNQERLDNATTEARKSRIQAVLTGLEEKKQASQEILALRNLQNNYNSDAACKSLREDYPNLFNQVKQKVSQLLFSIFGSGGFIYDPYSDNARVFRSDGLHKDLAKMKSSNNKSELDELIITSLDNINSSRETLF